VPVAMADKLMASVLSCFYSADPSGKPNAGKSYVIFGKQDNTAINLSIAWINTISTHN
jgi:hypothetical protein